MHVFSSAWRVSIMRRYHNLVSVDRVVVMNEEAGYYYVIVQ